MIARRKLSLLQLTAELAHVSKACNTTGYSRQRKLPDFVNLVAQAQRVRLCEEQGCGSPNNRGKSIVIWFIRRSLGGGGRQLTILPVDLNPTPSQNPRIHPISNYGNSSLASPFQTSPKPSSFRSN
jgi:hypothetical protein